MHYPDKWLQVRVKLRRIVCAPAVIYKQEIHLFSPDPLAIVSSHNSRNRKGGSVEARMIGGGRTGGHQAFGIREDHLPGNNNVLASRAPKLPKAPA